MSTSAPLASERAAISTPDGSDSTSPRGVNPRADEVDEMSEPLLLKLPIGQLCRLRTADVEVVDTPGDFARRRLLLHLTRFGPFL